MRWSYGAILSYAAWIGLLWYWGWSGSGVCEAECENAWPRRASKYLTVPMMFVSAGLLVGWMIDTRRWPVRIFAGLLLVFAALVAFALLWILTSN